MKFDKAANQLLRNYLNMALSIKLKRMPTEEEVFEEFMCHMDGRIKSDEDLRAEAFIARQAPRFDGDRKADLVELGYWESDEVRFRK